MQSLRRPVAETTMMMLRIIASQPPHTGTTLRAQPSIEVVPSETDESTVEKEVTFFNNSVRDDVYVIVREPETDQANSTGISVAFVTNGEMRNVDYVGTDIANIGTDVFKFLAAPL